MASRTVQEEIGASGGRFELAGFTVDPAANELVAGNGSRSRVEARAMDVLVVLHRRAGAVVSSDELLDLVWGGAAVSAHSVAIVISDLRKALGDDARKPRFIETVPKRGYRLVAALETRPPERMRAASPRSHRLAARLVPIALALAVVLPVAGALVAARWSKPSPAPRVSTTTPLDSELAGRYEQARELWSRREPEGALAARRLLSEILVQRDDFAPAHAAMADLYAHKTGEYLGAAPLDAYRAAQWHADRALELDPNQPDAHVTLALLAFYRDRQPGKALTALERALALDPKLARAWQSKGMVLSARGEHAASLEAIRVARELDPVSPSAAWDEVWFLYLAGRFDEAFGAAERAGSYSPRNFFYEALIEEGRGDHARALQLWLERSEQRAVTLAAPDQIRALSGAGRTSEAYRELLRQRRALTGASEWETVLAIWQLLAGDADAAAATLASTPSERENWTWIWLAEMPVFAPLVERDDVRALLARVDRPQSAG